MDSYQDGDISFNDDLTTDDFFTTPKTRLGRAGLGLDSPFSGLSSPSGRMFEDGLSQKIKSVQHTDTVSQ